MKHRKWDSKVKAQIVLEGLKGVTVAELCNRHGISQTQYYQWRDQFLRHLEKPFETRSTTQREEQLKAENRRLKSIVGELTMELKKSDYEQ